MKFQVDVGKLFLTLLATAITASSAFAIGALIEFQGVKRQVARHEGQLSVVSQIVCGYAIRDNLKDAQSICAEVLGGKQ